MSAGDVLAGHVRLDFRGSSPKVRQLQNAVYVNLHVSRENKNIDRPWVARHHWTREHVEYQKMHGNYWVTPITKEQAEDLLYCRSEGLDPCLVYKEDGKESEMTQPSSFSAGKVQPKPNKRYVQGPTVPIEVVSAYIDSLDSPSSSRDIRMEDRATRIHENHSVQDWEDA